MQNVANPSKAFFNKNHVGTTDHSNVLVYVDLSKEDEYCIIYRGPWLPVANVKYVHNEEIQEFPL